MTHADSNLNVLVLAASLRGESLNRKLADLSARIAERSGANVDRASMRDFEVPLYDGELQESAGVPQGALEFQRRLVASDAFIVASPEYNRSMPGAIKNLIDWTSRLRPQPFDGRHGLLLSASPSLAGGNRSRWRQPTARSPMENLSTRRCGSASRRTFSRFSRSPKPRSSIRA
jgi:chromate reductase, NAD(P)H dehydrogenase (quinone)